MSQGASVGPQHQAQALFGLLQALLGALEQGAIGEAHHGLAQLAGRVEFGVGVADQPAWQRARRPPDADDQVCDLDAGAQYDVDGELLGRHGTAVGTQQVPGGGAGFDALQLLGTLPQQFAGQLVGADDAAIGAMHDDACRQMIEQVIEPALDLHGSAGMHGPG